MWIELLKPVDGHTAGEFVDTDEKTARAYVDAGLAKEAGDGPDRILLQRAMEAYRSELSSLTRETATALSSATETLRRPRIEAGESETDKKHGRSSGDWLKTVVSALTQPDLDVRSKAHNRLVAGWDQGGYGVNRGMTEGSGASGGYTTPVLYESQVFEVAAESGVIVPNATVVPLGARTVEYPALGQYSAPSAGQSAFYGGVQISRKGENAQRSATAPTFAKISLTSTDLTAYAELSRDLVEDSTAVLDAMVPRLFGEAIGWREDWEALNGTGSGQFLGIYNAPATILLSRNTSSHIKYQDVFGMYVRLLSQSKASAYWLCHPYTVQELMQLVDPSSRFIMIPTFPGGNDSPLGAARATGFKMLGLPVVETEKAPALGTVGDLTLVDAKQYLVGRRSGLEIGLSEHFKFDTDQLAIRAKIRCDGQPRLKKAITLADGTNQVSAYVVLN